MALLLLLLLILMSLLSISLSISSISFSTLSSISSSSLLSIDYNNTNTINTNTNTTNNNTTNSNTSNNNTNSILNSTVKTPIKSLIKNTRNVKLSTWSTAILQLQQLVAPSSSSSSSSSRLTRVLRIILSWSLLVVSKIISLDAPFRFRSLVELYQDYNNEYYDYNDVILLQSAALGLIVGYGSSKIVSGFFQLISELVLSPATAEVGIILPLKAFDGALLSASRRLDGAMDSTSNDDNEISAVSAAAGGQDEGRSGFARRALDRGIRASNQLLYRAIFNLFPAFVESVCVLYLLINQVGVEVGLVAALVSSTYVILTAAVMNNRIPILRQQLKTEGIANGCAEDALSLAETVAAFGATDIEHQRYANALYKNSLTCISVRTSYSLLKLMQVSILGIGSALIAYVGWRSAVRDSNILFNNIPGKLVLIQGLFAQLCAPLDHVGQHFRDCVTASEDLRELLSLSSSLPPPSISSSSKPPSSLPLISRQYLSKSEYTNASPILEIRNLTFMYNSNINSNEEQAILKNISLTIPSGGMSVGIVGPSGSGKSTLLRVILGLEPLNNAEHYADNNTNSIFINGVDVTDMERMSCFAMVGQENDLFRSLTLAQNIMYGTSNTTYDSKLHEILVEKALANAVEDASLWPLILKVEGGWNAQVGPRGRLLSGGERARVCLARALFREEMQGGILLMDEITASLDAKTENMVTEAVEARVQKGATAILIAHRLASIQHCDKIIVMKDGRIIETGNHHSLMDKKGWYHDSWMIQQLSK